MRKIVIVWMLFCLFTSAWVFAAEEGDSNQEFGAVQSWDFDLQIKSEGRKIALEWTPFSGNKDFLWYKFVYSTVNEDPVYPDDGNRFLWGEAALSDAELYLHAEDYYVRLCAITQEENERGRYCGKVHFLEYESEERELKVKSDASVKKIDATKGETKKVEAKKIETTREVKEEAVREVRELDDDLKSHIDERLEGFINSLEEKGYTNEEIASTLNTIISTLDRYKEIEWYARIASYVQDILERYTLQYWDDLEIFDEIFWEF